LERTYPVTAFPASDNPLSAETLQAVFARTAEAPFSLTELTTDELPPVVIPPSRLNEIRREFYRSLGDVRKQARQREQEGKIRQALADLLPETPASMAVGGSSSVLIPSLRDSQLLGDPGIDRIIVPLTAGAMHQVDATGRRLKGRQQQLVWELPFFVPDDEWEGYRGAVRRLAEAGFRTFRLNNLGHFPFFDGLTGMTLLTGYRLFSLNSQAILAWQELGAAEVTLYIEDDQENLRQLFARATGVPAAVTVYAPVPLITSRIPVRGVRSDTPVLSDRGEAYRVEGRSGVTVLTAETDFSLLGRLRELRALGCDRFILDLSHIGPFSPRGKQVLDALRREIDPPNTSPFNFAQGME
jgi:putative protease